MISMRLGRAKRMMKKLIIMGAIKHGRMRLIDQVMKSNLNQKLSRNIRQYQRKTKEKKIIIENKQ